ncbi:hypothetical protein FHG87_016197 [Trinorchestia longiramus]|nr:hypothetical protein FHG87_016197 [Trinorchestia longiramus]
MPSLPDSPLVSTLRRFIVNERVSLAVSFSYSPHCRQVSVPLALRGVGVRGARVCATRCMLSTPLYRRLLRSSDVLVVALPSQRSQETSLWFCKEDYWQPSCGTSLNFRAREEREELLSRVVVLDTKWFNQVDMC